MEGAEEHGLVGDTGLVDDEKQVVCGAAADACEFNNFLLNQVKHSRLRGRKPGDGAVKVAEPDSVQG